MVEAIPLIALVVTFLASLWRGRYVSHSSDNTAWAFGSAKGRQRLAGAAFAISIVILAFAAAKIALSSDSAHALIGALVSIVGGAIVIVAQIQMGRAWRVGVRKGDAPLFVKHGLFRFSRNPVFVGMMLIGFGIAVPANSWWAWMAMLAFVLACCEQVRIEEAHLKDSFGVAYINFKNDIPRWIGIPK